MRVIATHLGYYKDQRRRIGAEFEMDEAGLKKDASGAPLLPKWVVEATPENRAKLAGEAVVARRRGLEAVQAAAGPKRNARQQARPSDEDAGTDLV